MRCVTLWWHNSIKQVAVQILIDISGEGVFKLLQGLNIHKAAGLDSILTRILKTLASKLTTDIAIFHKQ